LDRTVCYGTCPSYKLTIKADGSVVFEGREFVKQKGIVKSQISQEQLRALLVEFGQNKILLFTRQVYKRGRWLRSVATDNPTTTTSILINGKSKKVQHYHGCRGSRVLEDLTKFENKIDEIVIPISG